MRLKILPRYILTQFFANLILGLVIFTFVLLLDKLFELVDLLINKGAGLDLTLKMMGLLLPASLSLTLPMSNLLATLLTFGHLSETNEVTAIRASGIPAWDFAWTPVAVGLMSVLFLLPFNSYWAPHAQSKFRQIYVQLLERNPLVRIEEKTFTDVGEYHMYVEKKTWRKPPLRGITIYKTPAQGAPLRIFAERGEAQVDPNRGMWLILESGHLQEINPTDPKRWFYTTFNEYQFFIPFESQKQGSNRAIEEMDNEELDRLKNQLERKGLPAPLYQCEMQMRDALAVTPILFVLLGIPLALRVKRGGRSIGFGLSLLVVLVYYILIMGGVGMAQRGVWSAVPCVWFANVILTIVAAGLAWDLTRQ